MFPSLMQVSDYRIPHRLTDFVDSRCTATENDEASIGLAAPEAGRSSRLHDHLPSAHTVPFVVPPQRLRSRSTATEISFDRVVSVGKTSDEARLRQRGMAERPAFQANHESPPLIAADKLVSPAARTTRLGQNPPQLSSCSSRKSTAAPRWSAESSSPIQRVRLVSHLEQRDHPSSLRVASPANSNPGRSARTFRSGMPQSRAS